MIVLLAALLTLPLSGVQGADAAKTFTHVSIQSRSNILSADGGERSSGASFYLHPITIGRTDRWFLAISPDTCNFVLSFERRDAGAVAGWDVEVTPLSVTGEAVTFRLTWTRRVSRPQSLQTQNGEWQLTLRPGESIPFDLLLLGAHTVPSCHKHTKGMTLSVGVEREPAVEKDRRLVTTDLWLVERLPDGKEHSQQVSLRGRFGDPQPFFFEDLTDRGMRLDIYGDLVARARTGYIEIELETKRRFSGPDGAPLDSAVGTMKSLARVSTEDVAAIELPPLANPANGAFRDRVYSLRVRARQIRGGSVSAGQAALQKSPQVFVSGEVRTGGAYEFTGGMTVGDLIERAGGYTKWAAPNRLRVSRVVDGKVHDSAVTEKDALRAGDRLNVPRRRI